MHWQSAAGANKDKYTLKIIRSVDSEEQERRRREGTVSFGGSIDFRSLALPAQHSIASSSDAIQRIQGARDPDQPLPSSERDNADAVVVPDTPVSRKRRHSREHDFRPGPGSRDSSLLLTHVQRNANAQSQPVRHRDSQTPKSESPSERNLQHDPELPRLTTIEPAQTNASGDEPMTNGVEVRPAQTPTSSTRRQVSGFSTLDHHRSASKEALRRTSMNESTSPRQRVWEPESQESRPLVKKPTALRKPAKAQSTAGAGQTNVLVNGTVESSAPVRSGEVASLAGSSVVLETSQEGPGRQTNGNGSTTTQGNIATTNGNQGEDLDDLVNGNVTPEELQDAMSIDVPEIVVGQPPNAVADAPSEPRRRAFGNKTPTQNRPDFIGFERNSPKSILRRPSMTSDTGGSSGSTGRSSPNISRRSVEFSAGPPSILGQADEIRATKTARKGARNKSDSGSETTSSSSEDESNDEGEEADEDLNTPKAATSRLTPQSAKKANLAPPVTKRAAPKTGKKDAEVAIQKPVDASKAQKIIATTTPQSSLAKQKMGTTPSGNVDAFAAFMARIKGAHASPLPSDLSAEGQGSKATPNRGNAPATKNQSKGEKSASKSIPAKATPAKKATVAKPETKKTPAARQSTKPTAKSSVDADKPDKDSPKLQKATATSKPNASPSTAEDEAQEHAAGGPPLERSEPKAVETTPAKDSTERPAMQPSKRSVRQQSATMRMLNEMRERAHSASGSSPAPNQAASTTLETTTTPGNSGKARVPPGRRAKDATVSARLPSKSDTTASKSTLSKKPELSSAKPSEATSSKKFDAKSVADHRTDAEKVVDTANQGIPGAAREGTDAEKIEALQTGGKASEHPHEISSAEESSSDSDSDSASEIAGTEPRPSGLSTLPSGTTKESSDSDDDSDENSEEDSDDDADTKLKKALKTGPTSSQSMSLTPPKQSRKPAESEASSTDDDVDMPDAEPVKALSSIKSPESVPRAFENKEYKGESGIVKPLKPTANETLRPNIDFSDTSSEEYPLPAPSPASNKKPSAKRAVSETSESSSDASAYNRLPMPKQASLANGKKTASQANAESPRSTQNLINSQLNSEAAAFSVSQEPPKSSQFGSLDTPTPAMGRANRNVSVSGRVDGPRSQLLPTPNHTASLRRMVHKRIHSKSSPNASPNSTQNNAAANVQKDPFGNHAAGAGDDEEDEEEDSDDDDDSDSNEDSEKESRPMNKAKTTKRNKDWMDIVKGLPLHLP